MKIFKMSEGSFEAVDLIDGVFIDPLFPEGIDDEKTDTVPLASWIDKVYIRTHEAEDGKKYEVRGFDHSKYHHASMGEFTTLEEALQHAKSMDSLT